MEPFEERDAGPTAAGERLNNKLHDSLYQFAFVVLSQCCARRCTACAVNE
jgi:hypothetical protein